MQNPIILYWLTLAINGPGLFCEGETRYGILLTRYPTYMAGAFYNFTFFAENSSQNKNTVYWSFAVYEDDDVSQVLEDAKTSPQLENIPKQNILFKMIYNNALPADELEEILKVVNKLVEDYMVVPGCPKMVEDDSNWFDISLFGYLSIDINTKVLATNVMMIYRPDFLFMGFLVLDGQNLSPGIISKVKYDFKNYSIVAKIFECSSPLVVNYLMYIKLIKDSGENKEILHPCIPNYKFVNLKSIENTTTCTEFFQINHSIKFIGNFNKYRCEKLIENIITDKQLSFLYEQDVVNFANIILPLLDKNERNLKLYTSLIDGDNNLSGDIEDVLYNHECEVCSDSKIEIEIEATDIQCFQFVYLKFLIGYVLGFSGKNYVVTKAEPESVSGVLLFADVRIGYSLYAESNSVLTTGTIDSSSTTPLQIIIQITDETIMESTASQHQTTTTTDETVETPTISQQLITSTTGETIIESTTSQQLSISTINETIETLKASVISQQLTVSTLDETLKASTTTHQKKIVSTADETIKTATTSQQLITSNKQEALKASVISQQLTVSTPDETLKTSTTPQELITTTLYETVETPTAFQQLTTLTGDDTLTTPHQLTTSNVDKTIETSTTYQQLTTSTADETIIESTTTLQLTTATAVEAIETPISTQQLTTLPTKETILVIATKPIRLSNAVKLGLGIFGAYIILFLIPMFFILLKRNRISKFEKHL